MIGGGGECEANGSGKDECTQLLHVRWVVFCESVAGVGNVLLSDGSESIYMFEILPPANLKAGDIIVEADGKVVKGQMDLIRAVNEKRKTALSV